MVAGVIALVVVHAFLAVRKFPINYRQYTLFRGHMKMMRHEDTTLWWVQVFTGFALFFLATVHLYHADAARAHRPVQSADRVWSGRWWPLYILLLFAVELHGGIGLYRLAVKWGWFEGSDPNATPQAAEGAQVGADGVLPRARLRDARRLHEDRQRARAELGERVRARRRLRRPQGATP